MATSVIVCANNVRVASRVVTDGYVSSWKDMAALLAGGVERKDTPPRAAVMRSGSHTERAAAVREPFLDEAHERLHQIELRPGAPAQLGSQAAAPGTSARLRSCSVIGSTPVPVITNVRSTWTAYRPGLS